MSSVYTIWLPCLPFCRKYVFFLFRCNGRGFFILSVLRLLFCVSQPFPSLGFNHPTQGYHYILFHLPPHSFHSSPFSFYHLSVSPFSPLDPWSLIFLLNVSFRGLMFLRIQIIFLCRGDFGIIYFYFWKYEKPSYFMRGNILLYFLKSNRILIRKGASSYHKSVVYGRLKVGPLCKRIIAELQI